MPAAVTPTDVDGSKGIDAAFKDVSELNATAKIFNAIQGHWLSSCLRVLMELKIPEILSSASKPMPIAELASAAGVEGTSEHFYKVLRVSAQHDLIDEADGQLFSANGSTRQLVRGRGATLGHLVDHLINGPKWAAWNVLPEAVRTGKVAFALAHDGLDVHQYEEVPGNEAFADEMEKAMTYYTIQSLFGGDVDLKDAYDWKSAKVLMDVGGGRGELLSRVMSYAGPESKGVLLDRQWVLDSIDWEGTFHAKGVQNAQERLTRVHGDVREPFPDAIRAANVDTLMMKHFLSGFSDGDSKLILKHCAEVIPSHADILLLQLHLVSKNRNGCKMMSGPWKSTGLLPQTIVPEGGDRSHNTYKDGVSAGLFAVEVMAQCPGGGWRTLSEWESIFATAGFKLKDTKRVGASMDLLVWGRA